MGDEQHDDTHGHTHHEHEHHYQETKDGKANIDPKPLGKPEPIRQVLHDVAEGAAEFLEGHPPRGAKDAGHVEGANEE